MMIASENYDWLLLLFGSNHDVVCCGCHLNNWAGVFKHKYLNIRKEEISLAIETLPLLIVAYGNPPKPQHFFQISGGLVWQCQRAMPPHHLTILPTPLIRQRHWWWWLLSMITSSTTHTSLLSVHDVKNVSVVGGKGCMVQSGEGAAAFASIVRRDQMLNKACWAFSEVFCGWVMAERSPGGRGVIR